MRNITKFLEKLGLTAFSKNINLKLNSLERSNKEYTDRLCGGQIPIGAIVPFSGSQVPTGYLLCDGSAVSRTDYSTLFSVIGETFGSGDGSTTFNVPDLRDKFPQGANGNLGTTKEAGLPNIEGSATEFIGWQSPTSTGSHSISTQYYSDASISSTSTGSNTRTLKLDFNASQSNSIYGNSDTVQPPALCVNYIIRADIAETTTISGEVKRLNGHLSDNTTVSVGDIVPFVADSNSNMTITNGLITLKKGRTYNIFADLRLNFSSQTDGYCFYSIKDSNGNEFGARGYDEPAGRTSTTFGKHTSINYTLTPNEDIDIGIYLGGEYLDTLYSSTAKLTITEIPSVQAMVEVTDNHIKEVTKDKIDKTSITDTIDENSTDEQVPSAKAVYDKTKNMCTTSVADTSAYINLIDASVVKKTNDGLNNYHIKNGICDVSIDLVALANTASKDKIAILPKPAKLRHFTIPSYLGTGIILLRLNTDGYLDVVGDKMVTGERYLDAFSYIVAES